MLLTTYKNTSYKNWILLLLFIWMLGNFFPGSYNVDTWYQYFEMEKSDYDDWHSPWMAVLWQGLYALTDRFFIMYFFQMAWYFLFYYLLLRYVSNRLIVILALASSIFFVFIPQYIMKDVHLALAWCSVIIILLSAGEKQHWSLKWLALVLMVYGLFIRPNTIPALLSILYLFIETYAPRKISVVRKAIITLVLGAIFFGAYFVATYKVLHTRHAYPEYKLKLMDVIGISKLSGENYVPSCVSGFSGYKHDMVFEMYNPATIDHIYWPTGEAILPMPTEDINICVTHAWKKAVTTHPYLYIKNRIKGYLYYLKIWQRLPSNEYWNVTVSVVKNNYINIDDHHTPFTQKLVWLWDRIDKLHLYDPWFWLLLNVVLFILYAVKFYKHKIYSHKVLAALQLSGIIYTLGILPVFQIDRDFRYTFFNVFVFIVGAIYYFGKPTLPVDSVRIEKGCV